MSKKTTLLFIAASFLASSFTVASAQSLTRADVRAQLAEIEHAGYSPAAADAFYPASIQAAQARLEAQFSGQPQSQASANLGNATNSTQ